MEKLIFFSHNLNKIREVKRIFKNSLFKILTLNDLSPVEEPEENGITFSENATIKSNYGFKKFGLPCFADDTGICIKALDDKPGVRSKRFINENGGLQKTFEIITNETKRKRNINAFFKTAVSLSTANYVICFDGIVRGKISTKPIGNLGFHYDPIFIPNGTNKTYAQMQLQEKNLISHRAIAINKLKKYIESYSIDKANPSLI